MTVKLGDREVGPGLPPYVCAEVGLNANGTEWLLLDMMSQLARAGVDAVKLQKRTIEDVYGLDYLQQPRTSPFGETQWAQKAALEFDDPETWRRAKAAILPVCETPIPAPGSAPTSLVEKRAHLTASPWDPQAVADLEEWIDPPWYKVASPMVTHHELLRAIRDTGKPVVMSTGMCTEREISDAIKVLGFQVAVLLACTSSYPTDDADVGLRKIETLRRTYRLATGFSCHSPSIHALTAATALGACFLEFHVSPGRWMYGSDQAASFEVTEVPEIVEAVRRVHTMLGTGELGCCPAEEPVREKLRRTSE